MTRKKPDDLRKGIDLPALLAALQAHALGEEKMTATQVNAAIALLKKVLPDLPAPARRAPEDNGKQKTHEEALQHLE